MYAVDALFDHKYAFSALLLLDGEAVPQIEEVPLAVEKAFGLVLLIDEGRVLCADLILNHEDVNVGVPVFM